ncbi:MAG: carboxylesterase/lipase family protein [Erysipelotrichaceae bacterium]|nr:carboxylesterase/lipase family protein [Erysipelotrichaceae bacterium]
MKANFMKLLAAAGLAASLFGCSAQQPAQSDKPAAETADAAKVVDSSVRKTKFGDVVGVEENGVEVYYGIPYGKEPTGELRWKAPQDPDPWTETKEVKAKEEAALQSASVKNDKGETEIQAVGSTDCLNLDIYTEKDAKDLPVIVYVHGGNNQTGNSFEIPGYDMVKTDKVVYVSLNYRLGLLGFNNLPAILDSDNPTGNFAMLDLAKALTWVRENIANFGGNAKNVTVTGFSAGGRDVMAMLLSPQFEGLFDKAIAYSGGMTIADSDASVKKIAETIAPLVVEDKVKATEEEAAAWLAEDTREVADYLNNLSADRLIKLFPNAGIRMAKFPHLYNDGIVIPEKGFDSNTYVNDVPLMMVTGSEEFSMFGCFDPILDDMKDPAAAKAFVNKYGGDFYRVFNTQLSAEKMADSYKSNMYLCQINYGDSNSAYKIPDYGSFHGIFVPLISPSVNNYSALYDFTEAGYADAGKVFNEYLTSFVKTGSPSKASNDVEWTAWTKESPNTLVLDAKDGKSVSEMKDVRKSNAEIIQDIEADKTVPEDEKKQIVQNIMNGRWFSADLDKHFSTPSLW